MSESKERIVFGQIKPEQVAAAQIAQGNKNNAEDKFTGAESNASSAAPQLMPFSEKSAAALEKHQKLMDHLESQKRARSLIVPTKDPDVRAKLRELGEPITLFGELPQHRRNRLRELLAKMGIGVDEATKAEEEQPTSGPLRKREEGELFYTEAGPELRTVRLLIARTALPRATARIEAQRKKRALEEANELEATAAETAELDRIRRFENSASQVGDDRALAWCALDHYSSSSHAQMLATASWSGLLRVWDVTKGTAHTSLTAHRERASCVQWLPPGGKARLVSCGFDSLVRLWSVPEDLPSAAAALQSFEGHADKVNRLAVHPTGRFVGSTSWDCTWRLWDLETSRCVLIQEGHSRAVFPISFQCDGSLAVTAGNDDIGRVWDLRTGKSIVMLQGHSKEIHAAAFHPNGYQLATGSDDNTVRIWDLRKKKAVYVVPAHTSVIADIKFQQGDGNYMVTACYDQTLKVWSCRDWSLVKTLAGHESKVTSCDIESNGRFIVSSSGDRTWKTWSPEP